MADTSKSIDRLDPPAGVHLRLEEGILRFTGLTENAWLRRALPLAAVRFRFDRRDA